MRDNLRENKRRIAYNYQPDDMVYVTSDDITRKLSSSKRGPFKILRVYTNGTVTLQISDNVEETVNIRRLQPTSLNA